MSREMDESQLTAYALGELSAAEAGQVEQFLARDDEARRALAELLAVSEALASADEGDLLLGGAAIAAAEARLTDSQRQAVLAGPADGARARPRRLVLRRWGALAAAAAILVGLAVGYVLLSRTPPAKPDAAKLAKPKPKPAPQPQPGDPGFENTPGITPPVQVRNVAPPQLEYVPTPRNFPRPPGQVGKQIVRFRTRVLVPAGIENAAAGKPVASSEPDPIAGDISWITDGDKDPATGLVELGPGLQWVQVDLGRTHRIYAVVVWHCFLGRRVYRDVIVHAGNHPDFVEEPIVLFNNDGDNSAGLGLGKDAEYMESNAPLVVAGRGARARYVRLYSAGNSGDDRNHYTEVEIYAQPTSTTAPAPKKLVPLEVTAPELLPHRGS